MFVWAIVFLITGYGLRHYQSAIIAKVKAKLAREPGDTIW